MLWIALSALQIMTHIPCINILLPSIALYFLEAICPLSTFRLLELRPFHSTILTYKEEKTEFALNFHLLEYFSFNFIENTGLVFLVLILASILAFIVYFLKIFKRTEKYCSKISEYLHFNFFLRSFLLSYLMITLSTFIGLNGQDYSLSGEAMGSLIAILFTPIVTLAPFALIIFFIKNKKNLKNLNI